MTDLVTQQAVLTRLRDAEKHAGLGDCSEALARLSEALDEVLSGPADRKCTASGSTPYTFGPEHGFGNITARPDSQFVSQLGE